MNKSHDCGFAWFRELCMKDNNGVFFFSILANEEKNEGGEITKEMEDMYTNLFQFHTQYHIITCFTNSLLISKP